MDNDTDFITDTGWTPEWPVLYCDDCGAKTFDYDNVIVPAMPVDIRNARRGQEAVLCNTCADRILGDGSWNSWEAGMTALAANAMTALAKRAATPVPDPRVRMTCAACGFMAEGSFGSEGIVRFLDEHDAGQVTVVRYLPKHKRPHNVAARLARQRVRVSDR